MFDVQCAKFIKESMEEKYPGSWQVFRFFFHFIWKLIQVVIGESFGLDMTYDKDSLFYMYFVGTVACFVWRCSR